jgi:phosphoribosylformimino-5-aminoimidazole carboxamide ribotide isomerase
MLIIPAIDLKEGQCVRLSQGRMDDATVYSSDPVETALRWQSLGARRLHIVDLDGAVSGMPVNKKMIEKICSAVAMDVELGGGIRDLQTVRQYINTGVDYVILGTAAVRDPALLASSCAEYPGKIIIGIDARDGMIAVQGWTEKTAVRAIDFARALDPDTIAAIVFTDIQRDGMLTGPNIDSTAALARAVGIPVIASGGVSRIDDIRHLLEVEQSGIMGVIIGRALYTGSIDLKQCISLTRE